MTAIASHDVRAAGTAAPGTIKRYNLFERIVHWTVGLSFVALMLSGLALGYPRLYWLSGVFGGGQTMRAAHPWIGVGFTAGIVVMLVIWAKPMLFDADDRLWVRRIRTYAATGHSGVDNGRWNAGQKGYFWVSVLTGVVLLVTGIPLWFPSLTGAGILRWSRFIHHAVFLLTVGGFIVHVLLSAVMFPGTMSAMSSGRVSRGWAAYHHPRWFREQRRSMSDAGDGERAG
jgi:formate dehydrogenase subunit gamma